MRRIRAIAYPEQSLERATPAVLIPGDPWAGDERLEMSGDHADYKRSGVYLDMPTPLGPEQTAALDREFETRYGAILDGEADYASIESVARSLLVWGARRHDRRPLIVAPCLVADTVLSDLAENQLPQVGLIGPDRVLGPFSEVPTPRWVRVLVGAVMAFVPEVPPGVPAWSRSSKRRPRPDPSVRAGLRAMARVPPMLWRVTGPNRIEPHLPLAAMSTPSGPVDGVPATPAVVGRAVPTRDGWGLAAALPLPRLPPAEPLIRRLDLELMRLRRRERRLTWEDLLRERSEVLYRTTCEWLWLIGADGSWPSAINPVRRDRAATPLPA